MDYSVGVIGRDESDVRDDPVSVQRGPVGVPSGHVSSIPAVDGHGVCHGLEVCVEIAMDQEAHGESCLVGRVALVVARGEGDSAVDSVHLCGVVDLLGQLDNLAYGLIVGQWVRWMV